MKSVPNEAAWKAIMSLAHARTVAKARETELVTTRRDLEGQLDALGAGSGQEHLRVSRDYVVTLRSIDHERDRMRSLADKLENAINDASQGKFEFAEDVDDRELVKKPSEQDLFHVTPAPEAKPKDSRPVGRHNTPEVPAPAVAQGENQHLIASVNELDCIDKLKGKLIDAGYTTMGALFAIIEHDDIEANKLSEAVNVTGAAARTIVAAARKWQKAHRKAALAADKEAAGG